MSMEKPKTLFDHLRAITREQDPNYWSTLSESDKKSFSTYMVNRFLSMNPDWVEVVDALQHLTQIMEPEQVYLTYISVIPKSSKFFKYIKGEKKNLFQDWIIELVSKHYACSLLQAEEYLEILYASEEGRDNILYICEMYGVDKKQIRSLKLGKRKP